VTGKFGFKLRSAYAAAKHALHGYFESLALENDGVINVTLVCPGRIRTNISLYALRANGAPHGQMDEGQLKGVPVEKCADQIIKGIRRNKREVFIGGAEVVLVYIKRFFPALFYRIARKASAT
jgi:short-subunit dehydrogenase